MSAILACLLALSLMPSQKTPSRKVLPVPEPVYTVGLGASPSFHASVLKMQRELSAKKFDAANQTGNLLPKSVATIRVDLKNVPPERKETFLSAVKFAAERWGISMYGAVTLRVVTSGPADILVGFEPVLAKLPTTGEQAGATWFYGTKKGDAVLECVIGLKRGPDLKLTQDKEVHNEALFTVGAYFGLNESGIYGNAMGRLEGEMSGLNAIEPPEAQRAKTNLKLAKDLRLAALAKKVVTPKEPSLFVEKTRFDFKNTLQGDDGREEMTIANRGNAPLLVYARGDCSCVLAEHPTVIKPGSTERLKGIIKTTELDGEVNHNILLETNDSERPLVKIPVKINVRPRLIAVFPTTDTIDVTEELTPLEFYIHSEEARTPKILAALINGSDLGVSYEPFTGSASDFRQPGKSRNIKGYRIKLNPEKLRNTPVYGRLLSTLFVRTDNEVMPLLRVPVYVQKGIIASPDSVYLGSPTGPLEFGMTVLRPGRPFKIKRISASSKHISATVVRSRSDFEYTLRVQYDGKAEEHRVKTEVVIETDDPKQPVIKVPVETSPV
jgi:hypothetical protein